MKSFVAFLALVAVAAADVSHLNYNNDKDAVIVKQNADVFPDQYAYEYETSNGISAQERGVLENVGREDEGISAQGSYAWTSPEGENVRVQYVADKDGNRAEGSHIPVPPPIPEYILRSLAWIASQPIKPEPGLRS